MKPDFKQCAICGVPARLIFSRACPHSQIDRTPEGAQCVLPGAERASDKTMAQRRADAPLRPKKNQRPCDAGLFSDERDQTSLI